MCLNGAFDVFNVPRLPSATCLRLTFVFYSSLMASYDDMSLEHVLPTLLPGERNMYWLSKMKQCSTLMSTAGACGSWTISSPSGRKVVGVLSMSLTSSARPLDGSDYLRNRILSSSSFHLSSDWLHLRPERSFTQGKHLTCGGT